MPNWSALGSALSRGPGSAIDAHQLALAPCLAQGRARLGEARGGGADEVDGPFDGRTAAKARLDRLLQLANGVEEAARLATDARVVAARLRLRPEVSGAELALVVQERSREID